MIHALLRFQRPVATSLLRGSYCRSTVVAARQRPEFLTTMPLRFASSSSTTTTTNNDGNNNKTDGKNNHKTVITDDVFERTVYVHPLSQIILEYLQDAHHDFVVAQQLDSALRLHRDGSFELTFPDNSDARHRIWTSYDEVEKKHWLSVYRGPQLQERFLLQDNLLPAWNMNRKSLPERIHVAVDQMVDFIIHNNQST